jgi:serine/threonine protein phosphatase 1
MQRIFVMGDIHGAYRAMKQCLEKSAFNYDNDKLICLGDVADGWPDTKQCIDELLRIKNLIYLLGNHDYWTLDWMENGVIEEVWFEQGGQATIQSYNGEIPDSHIKFLKEALPYYFIGQKKLFVHAGIEPDIPIEKQSLQTLIWDRNFARIALDLYLKQIPGKLTEFDEIYLGHTPIPFTKPIKSGEVWLMDTGAGWSGVLSMMDIATKEIFTSDPVPLLYPGVEGRKRR